MAKECNGPSVAQIQPRPAGTNQKVLAFEVNTNEHDGTKYLPKKAIADLYQADRDKAENCSNAFHSY
jgi:hypothetical protein